MYYPYHIMTRKFYVVVLWKDVNNALTTELISMKGA